MIARTRSEAHRLIVVLFVSLATPAFAGPPGDFDYYLFEQSWLPEFCTGTVARKPTQMPHPECKDIESRFGATHPTVHGLWPQGDEPGEYPAECAGSPGCDGGNVCSLDTAKIDDAIEQELESKWMPGFRNLAQHEWRKHGTCTGLDQNAYLAETIRVAALVPVQPIPDDLIGQQVGLEDLRGWWGEPRAAFLCERRDKKQFLKAVRTCWERTDDMTVGERFACPADIADICIPGQKITLTKAQNLPGTGGHGHHDDGSPKKGCTKPGQGPACKSNADCTSSGWLRCAKSKCCTDQPL